MPRLVHVIPHRQFVKDGRVYTLRKARACHRCKVCPQPIDPGMLYYSVTWGGAGLGSLKFPDSIHLECVDKIINGGEQNGRNNQPDA